MISKEFMTAGSAIFTIEPPAEWVASHEGCAPHYTYRVSHKEASEKGGEVWFVSLLTGPSNTSDYTYMGLLDLRGGSVRLTRASRFGEDALPVRLLRRVLGAIWGGREGEVQAAGWNVHHEGRCGRCGRVLSTPASVTAGVGPECARKMAGGG